MSRTRAIGIFGLVLGLSGCAGTHKHQHFPAVGDMPQQEQANGLVQSNCGCRPMGTSLLAGMVGRRTPVVATVAPRLVYSPTMPAPPERTVPPLAATTPRATTVVAQTVAPSRPQEAETPVPPSSIPVAVPAPTGVARSYFPSFGGDDAPSSVWDPVPPDLLGVRTSLLTPPAAAGDEPPASLSHDAIGSLSLASPLPAGPAADREARRGDLRPTSVEVRHLAPAPAPASSPTGQLPPAGTVNLPPFGRPDLAVGDATASPPTTLTLEHADASELAGRPRLEEPPAEPALVRHDQDGPSTWVSELAFQPPRKPAGLDWLPGSSLGRGNGRSNQQPKRTTVVSRFVRRIRVAGRAFLDPDSVRREAGDLPQQGDGIERASTDRLGESAKR